MAEQSTPAWLPNVLGRPYPDMMRQFFVHSADEILRRRQPAGTREAWQSRREQVRQGLIAAMGGFPERTPLNARITNTHQRQGYRIENVVFESRPGFYVTCSVYVPDGLIRPAPAVLCPHGHWQHGRYEDIVQRRCVGLARRGYVTLSIDAVGYNDREAMGHRRSWFLFSAGMTVEGVQTWDNMRAIDYLCSREDVDPERIGCTGCSGGGNQTMYVSALDERIKAAVPVCSVEMIADYMEKGFCTCEGIPGEVGVADLTEITGLVAPRALLLIHGILDDGFPILSARMAAARIRDIYRHYDPERFAAFESYDGHAYNAEMRQAMYRFFDRWLMGRETDGAEEEPGPDNLRVLPEGLPAGHATLSSLFVDALGRQPVAAQPTSAQDWQSRRQALTAGLETVFGGLPARGDLDVRPLGTEQRDGYRTERFWFRSEPDVVIPACLLLPDGDGPRDAVVYLLAGGKDDLTETMARNHLAQGRAVLAIDQRGVGETAWDAATFHTSAFALGRPSLALHAWDLMRAVELLRLRPDILRTHVVAAGTPATAMTSLLATALDRGIASLTLDRLPASLRVPYTDFSMDTLYLPNLLKVADIPDLLAMAAPRPVSLAAALDAELQPLPAAGARQALADALHIYSLLGADSALRVGPA